MARRVVHAYVFPYSDNGTQRAIVYCSQDCGNNSLEYPPASWDTFRAQVSHVLLDAITCHGCGLTIAEANPDTRS
jgi:hypothetical protein